MSSNNNLRGPREYKNDRPRNEVFTLPLPEAYYNRATKQELDKENILKHYQWFMDNGVFDILSTYVQVPRSLLMDDESKKGFINVGYISDIDIEKNTMSITVYGSYVEQVDEMCGKHSIMVSPRIYSPKNDPLAITFTNFDLVVKKDD